MAWLLRKLRPKSEDYGPRAEDYAASIIASQGPSPASEELARQDMGINIHTIEDEKLVGLLDNLCVVSSKVDFVNPETGKVETQEIRYVRPWAVALKAVISKVNACRFLSYEEAVTTKLKLRNEVEKIKLTMTESDLEMFGPFINILVAIYAEPAIDDSIHGQKMLALKAQSHEFKVGLSNKDAR